MITTISSFIPKLPYIFSFPTRLPKNQAAQANIVSLAGRVSADSAYTLTEADKKQVKEAVQNHFINESIPSETYQKIFAELFPENEKNFEKFLERLDQKALLHLAGLNDEQASEKMNVQTHMKDVALKSVLATKGKALWREFAPQAVDFFHHIMDILIHFLQLNDIRPGPVESNFEASMKIEAYATILGYPAVIFGAVYAFSGSVALAIPATIVTVIATAAALFIYMRHFRPCPKEFFSLENLTQRVVQTDEPPVFPRRELLNQITTNFQSGKGALLIGEPGCGKSSLAKALAQLVADGEIDFLKDAQIFQTNVGGQNPERTSYIQHVFSKHKKKVVFFLDEIASLFKENSPLQAGQSDQLKTFCDFFPYVIIATTQAEYDKYLKEKDPAFLRRFGAKPITVPSFSENEIESILKKQLHFQAPELIWDADVISHIAKQASVYSPNTAQVDAAFSLLKLLIVKATVLSLPNLEKELTQLRSEKDSLQIELLNQYNADAGKKYQEVKQALDAKENELAAKKGEFSLIQKIEAQFVKIKQQSYILADSKNESARKKWLQNHIIGQILQRNIESKRSKLGLPPKLDKALVDKVI